MNQILLGNFQLVINEKLFQYSFMPPATFENLFEGLETFKKEIELLKAQADAEQASKVSEKEAELAAAEQAPEDCSSVCPKIDEQVA